MKKITIASALALGGLMSAGAGTAAADAIQVDGNYATMAACQADGPQVQITEDNGAYTHWSCHQGEDGLYYLYLSN
ncbi:MAG: hypothetical protein KIH64_007770 [Mycobacterium sp.]|nr:hypothetical protein [Mycobacterium sp.]